MSSDLADGPSRVVEHDVVPLDAASPRSSPWRRWEVALAVFFGLLPFVRAVLLWRSGWVAIGDNANIAIRAQDVGTGATPLLGMPSGLVGLVPDSQTSHPGPLVFWAVGPWVRAFGNYSLPVLLGAASVASAASMAILWCARRLSGRRGMAAAAVVLTTVLALTPFNMVQPLNPVMGLLPALAALLAASAVAAGDDRSGPVLVGAASFAAQADVIYTPVMVAVVAAVALRRWLLRDAPAGAPPRRMMALTIAVAAFCWSGPMIDALANRGGNVVGTITAAGGAPLDPQGVPAVIDALRSMLHPLGWVVSIQARPPGGFEGAVLLIVGFLTVFYAARRGVRHDRQRAVSIMVVVVAAMASTLAGQAATPGVAGRQATYLFPVLISGGFLWFAVGALLAPGIVLPIGRRRAVVAVTIVAVLGLLVGLRAALERSQEPGSDAAAALHRQARRSVRSGRMLLLPAGGPTSQSVLRGIGYRLEGDGFETEYPDDQAGFVGSNRTVAEDHPGIDRLLITRPISGPAPAGWDRVAAWEPDGTAPDGIDDLRSRVARQLRATDARFTHQAASFQIGQVLALTKGADASRLIDGRWIRALGQELLDHPQRLASLPDATLATLAEEGTIDLSGLDPDLSQRFLQVTKEDALELWLVVADP